MFISLSLSKINKTIFLKNATENEAEAQLELGQMAKKWPG